MGSLVVKGRRWWSSPEPEGYDNADPSTGLTPREVDAVRVTWAEIRRDSKANGIEIFLKLFDYRPEYQKLFQSFADVPRSELKSNGKLLAHATSVMYSLTSLVDHLDDQQCLVELLEKIARSHMTRKITKQHFLIVEVVVLELLKEKTSLNDIAEKAWKKIFTIIVDIVAKVFESNSNQEDN